jgi:ubiquinone/menaquinone biosynthesis C-methylase UbiE
MRTDSAVTAAVVSSAARGGGCVFDRSARFYDVFYDAQGKDYRREAEQVTELVRARVPAARTLLDVACGTGRHLEVFAERFDCVGVDLDAELLAVAAQRCPTVRFVQGDMTVLDLGETFDVVTCLFSSIAYVVTEERLRATVGALARHLAPGGVLVVEPFFSHDNWSDGHVGALFVDEPHLKAARINSSRREGDRVTLLMHYLGGGDGEVDYLYEEHELGLFDPSQYLAAFEDSGLAVEYDEEGLIGRGLVVGVRSAR